MKKIVIYDFDYTLCRTDSLKSLIYFTSKKTEILTIFALVLYHKLIGKLDVYKRKIIKDKFLNIINRPIEYDSWRKFVKSKIDFSLLSEHLEADKIVLSGSYKEILSSILDDFPELEVFAARLLDDENSYNAELKKEFIRNLKEQNYLIAYGDSFGDIKQIPLVDEFYLVTKYFGRIRLK